jgi:hypothetical protein
MCGVPWAVLTALLFVALLRHVLLCYALHELPVCRVCASLHVATDTQNAAFHLQCTDLICCFMGVALHCTAGAVRLQGVSQGLRS